MRWLKPILAAVIAAWMTTSATAEDLVTVAKNQSEFINLPDLAASVEVSKSGIVKVEKGATKAVLIVHGVASGETTLNVRLMDGSTAVYRVQVVGGGGRGANLNQVAARLREIAGLSIEVKGSRIYVSGRISTRGDALKFAQIKDSARAIIVDGTEREILESSAIVRTINRVLEENDIANVKAHSYGSILMLEGSPANDKQKALALRIAKAIAPQIEDNLSTDSKGAPSVAIEVMFVEVQKTDSKEWGVRGAQELLGASSDKRSGISATATRGPITREIGPYSLNYQLGPLKAFLRMIQTRAASRVLSNPKLIARSGEEATFHSGGTFYIGAKQIDEKSGSVVETITPVNTGIELGILPKLDAIGAIDSVIKTSIIDRGDEQVDGKPSLTTSKVDTAVTIRDGQSLMLSGLTRKSKAKRVERVPLLADVPLLGELFKSRQIEERETELLVIVTMTRVQATASKFEATNRLYEDASDDVDFSFFE